MNLKDQIPTFAPYVGCEGEWVAAKQFNSGGKTFGYYQCNYCQKTWMSAHSKKYYKQGCKNCSRYFYARFYWKNQEKVKVIKEKNLIDKKKPHMSELCQACKKGVCIL